MKLFNLRLLCLVFCMMLATSTDAFAFGKRGKGLFGWRSNSCNSCDSQSQCYGSQCTTNCENGQCQPQVQSSGYRQICDGNKCYLVAETGPQTLGTSPSTFTLNPTTITLRKEGEVWKDSLGQVWKK